MEAERRWSVLRTLGAVIGFSFLVWLALVCFDFFGGSKLVVGPETTFVNGPLTAEGLIDYEAALHERLSVGVSPDNNAAVLLDRAFGPAAISPHLRVRYFKWLGIEPLPERGDYVVNQAAFAQQMLGGVPDVAERQATIFDELRRAQQRPWTRDECPLAAEWLAANEKPLELIEAATKRSNFYAPLVKAEQLAVGESNIQSVREAARLLVTRAMFRLGEDDVAGAWSDLLACHRLARLIGQRPQSTIVFLVAVAVDAAATAGDAALIAHGLSVEQARLCLADHTALPEIISVVEVLQLGERLVCLDSMQSTSVGAGFDLNVTLRRVNSRFDDSIAAMKLKGNQKRREALDKLSADLNQRAKTNRQPLRLVAGFVISPRKAISNSVSDTLIAMMDTPFALALKSDDRVRIKSDLVRVGFALAAYRAEQSGYPMGLDDLVPKYLAALPTDRMNDQPLRYVVRESGFLIYSVGANGRNDDGANAERQNQDDISFEAPPP
ncbi:MAG: hypothetical protein NTZ32_14175 [Planctomycetales bacterium]|nr:hypothetical protein [Planctomycetales bacterium]